MRLVELYPFTPPKPAETMDSLNKIDKLGLLALLTMKRGLYLPAFLVAVQIQNILNDIIDRRGFESFYYNYNGLLWPSLDSGLLQKQMERLVNIEFAQVVERGVVDLPGPRGSTIRAIHPVYTLTKLGEDVKMNFWL